MIIILHLYGKMVNTYLNTMFDLCNNPWMSTWWLMDYMLLVNIQKWFCFYLFKGSMVNSFSNNTSLVLHGCVISSPNIYYNEGERSIDVQ